jgi:predicted nucleic-acid-binding protein
MNYDVEYTDIIKAYQVRTTDFLNQLITAEAKLNASATFIKNLQKKIKQLEEENLKLNSHKTIRSKKSSIKSETESVIDYN